MLAILERKASDELECDFAEVYHVFDPDSLPITKKATLAAGLMPTSRAKIKAFGRSYSMQDMLLMGIYDAANWLVWSKTKDGSANRNRPKPIREILEESEKHEQDKQDLMRFDSPEEFLKYMNRGERSG